jgi:hypothetical protein
MLLDGERQPMDIKPAVELCEMEIEAANSPDICASGLGYRKKKNLQRGSRDLIILLDLDQPEETWERYLQLSSQVAVS